MDNSEKLIGEKITKHTWNNELEQTTKAGHAPITKQLNQKKIHKTFCKLSHSYFYALCV